MILLLAECCAITSAYELPHSVTKWNVAPLTGSTYYPAVAVRVNKSCLLSARRLDIHSLCRFRHSCCHFPDELQHLPFPHPPEQFLSTFCLRFAPDIDEVFDPRTFLQLLQNYAPRLPLSTEYISEIRF